MADVALLERAARCYEQARLPREAARCYHDAGAYRRSAELYERLGLLRAAAADYARSGMVHLAAWMLVHDCDDPAEARRVLSSDAAAPSRLRDAQTTLRWRTVQARCEYAEGRPAAQLIGFLEEVCDELADRERLYDRKVEEWAVALAAAIGRDDYVALLFAAAVRGRRGGARERWQYWAQRTLGTMVILPSDEEAVT